MQFEKGGRELQLGSSGWIVFGIAGFGGKHHVTNAACSGRTPLPQTRQHSYCCCCCDQLLLPPPTICHPLLSFGVSVPFASHRLSRMTALPPLPPRGRSFCQVCHACSACVGGGTSSSRLSSSSSSCRTSSSCASATAMCGVPAPHHSE